MNFMTSILKEKYKEGLSLCILRPEIHALYAVNLIHGTNYMAQSGITRSCYSKGDNGTYVN